ncbi:hypothetical protein CRE_26511 [Caenorhabditis remanei]|uniref:GYF domain-containing protein n=1 Tax=Caenorhabditis remanei TaxID=31234 RepID=E3LQY4_CAERE|nr:hypothetical protein CRE_26511 [Caenorhabditis remanei]
MSSVSSAEPTAQQNFNPSWMRPNAAANRGGLISSGGHRLSGIGGGGFDDGGEDISSSSAIAATAAAILSSPVVSEYSYTRERLLELAPTGSIMPEALRDQLFFNEKNLPLVSNTPLTDLEQKLQHNINSSKAMSLLSHADRASIAAGAAYGSGYGGGLSSLQNGQPATNRWTPKSSWSKSPLDRPVAATARTGGSVGRAAGTFFAGRGAARIGNENGYGGLANGGSSPVSTEDTTGAYQPKFTALRRGGGAVSVGRGGSTTGASFNTRADALYNPNDPTDRPKAVNVAATRSESDDEEEEGWSKVGATPRTSTNTAPSSSDRQERPAWVRSESWIQRTQQQQQQQQQQSSQPSSQPPISSWNSGSDSAVWRDRNQMVASVKKTSADDSSSPQTSHQQQLSSQMSVPSREEMESAEVSHLSMPTYQPNSSTWSNNPMGGGMGVFFQPPIASAPVPLSVPKEEPVEFYYMDPTDTRRGPFHKDQMTMWFKAGYFTDESLRVQRGENGEYKTIGDLKKLHGLATPFDYPEEIEKPRVVAPPPTSVSSIPAYPSNSNPMFPAATYSGMNMWPNLQPNDMMSMMQSTFEQTILAERQRLAEEHNRRMQEEAEKMAKFQEAMYRQLSIQQELSQQQIREQEMALQRHRDELIKQEEQLKRETQARQESIEKTARELANRIEEEQRKKREEEEQRRLLDENQRREVEAKLAAERRIAAEAAEKERRRQEALYQEAEKKRLEIEQRERAEELRKLAEKERIAREAAAVREQAELEAVWTSKKVPVPAPWAANTEVQQKSEKTLLEIQLEEERKLKAEKEKNAKLKAKEQSVIVPSSTASTEKSSSLWGATKTWAAPETNTSSKSFVSPFLDGPSLEAANKMALQKKNSQSKIVVSKPASPAATKSKAAPVAAPPQSTQKVKKSKEQLAADELQHWFVKRFQQHSVDIDALTLFECILPLENPNEVEDIVMSYLDESKTVKEFVREFIKRRIAMRAAGGARPDADDLTSARTAAAAPSDSNSGSNSTSGNGQGKKKKKTQKQVLDGNILGFRGAAASDRLNKGEIDAIPTAPVNPSRR